VVPNHLGHFQRDAMLQAQFSAHGTMVLQAAPVRIGEVAAVPAIDHGLVYIVKNCGRQGDVRVCHQAVLNGRHFQ
jgi:hypothetical protein